MGVSVDGGGRLNQDGRPLGARGRQIFLLIEALRGIAALLVVTRHVAGFFPIRFPVSYLAVDLFYLLSGFVIPFSYEYQLLHKTIDRKDFILYRLIRLYPLYCFFTVVGIVSYIIHSDNYSMSLFVKIFLSLSFMPILHAGGPLYPFDHPSWSLFFELFISLLYGAVLFKISNKSLIILAVVSFVVLAYGAFHDPRNLDIGWMPANFVYGFLRVIFSFTLGTIIFRRSLSDLAERTLVKTSNTKSVMVIVIAVALLTLPIRQGVFATVYCLIAISILFPLLLSKAIHIVPTSNVARVSAVLGIISYPLYVAHVPIYNILNDILDRFGNNEFAYYAPASGLLFLAILSAFCYFIDIYVDLPLRRKLRSLISN